MTSAAGPASTLATGLVTFLGLWGTGVLIARAMWPGAPDEIRSASAPVLGVATLGILVELLGMAGMASRPALIGVWLAIVIAGVTTHVVSRSWSWPSAARSPLVALAVVAAIVALVAALAPSSKIDETYYHMLVPRRLVEDGGLRFYRYPIEAAMLPQMLFQIAMAPLHALGVPDAANVVSWSLGMTLLVFAWRFVSRAGGAPQAAWGVLVLACMPYITVWYTTGGSHAFGDLAMMLAVVIVARSTAGDDAARPMLLASALACCGAAAKLSTWPLAAAITLFAAWRARGAGATRAIALAAAPWIVVMAPIALWTYAQSGSPFGPMLTGLFRSTVYAPGETRAVFAAMRAQNSWQRAELLNFIGLYSPLLWLGAIAGLRWGADDAVARRVLTACAVGQLALVVILLPHEARFLSGLPFALFVLAFAPANGDAASGVRRKVVERVGTRGGELILAALTIPWLAFALYLGGRSAPVVVGVRPRDAYMDQYVALARDFRALDSVLPRDARLLVAGEAPRIPLVYAPRPVYLDERDLPAAGPVYVLAIGTILPAGAPRTLQRGRLVYVDSAATTVVYRTIASPPDHATVRVYTTDRVTPPARSLPAEERRPPGR